MSKDIEKEKQLAAKEAVKFINDYRVVGLGTGSTADYAIREIGDMVKNGLNIQAVPTSNKTKLLAQSFNIPLVDINTVDSIDITIDGADAFTEDLILIKGGGGALLKEKVVASIAKEVIIIVDSSKKASLAGKFKVPVEVIPFASRYVLNQIHLINGIGNIRLSGDQPFITEHCNFIVDVDFGRIDDLDFLSYKLNSIEGIVAHGLFIKLASKVIMGENDSTVAFKVK
jgi:ribose 5-phosphate isomerase A